MKLTQNWRSEKGHFAPEFFPSKFNLWSRICDSFKAISVRLLGKSSLIIGGQTIRVLWQNSPNCCFSLSPSVNGFSKTICTDKTRKNLSHTKIRIYVEPQVAAALNAAGSSGSLCRAIPRMEGNHKRGISEMHLFKSQYTKKPDENVLFNFIE